MRKNLIKTIALIGIIFSIYYISTFLGYRIYISPESKEFKFKNCVSCEKGICNKKENIFVGFKVFDSKIQIYRGDGKGTFHILELQNSNNTKCAIAKHKNFAFSCDVNNYDDGLIRSTSQSFDGENKFKWSYFATSGTANYANSEVVCEVD